MISTHILDTSKGHPAGNVSVRLQIRNGDSWQDVSKGTTDSDGRFAFDSEKKVGLYQLIFDIEAYLKKGHQNFFFPVAYVVFKIEDTNRKYHVPLLLNPFGYSTYRGS